MNGHAWKKNNNEARSRKNCGINAERKRNARRPLPKPHETEEEAIIRRFHDAQRMARFRAKRKKAMEEAKAMEAAGFTEMSVISELRRRNITFEIAKSIVTVPNSEDYQRRLSVESPAIVVQPSPGQSKYSQLLAVIEELGKDIRLSYAGSRSSAERLKIGIVQARTLVKDCLSETEMYLRQ